MKDDRPGVIAGSVVALLTGLVLVALALVELGGESQDFFYLLLGACFALFVGLVLAAALTKDPFRKAKARFERLPQNSNVRSLEFIVGDVERHLVSYRWDQMWGWLTVTVADVLVVRRFVLLAFRLLSTVEFEVGRGEKHTVRVEKRRTLFLSFARPQPLTGFVDGVIVATDDGTRTSAAI